MKITVDDAELFIDAYVKIDDCYAKVIRVYNNGILHLQALYRKQSSMKLMLLLTQLMQTLCTIHLQVYIYHLTGMKEHSDLVT